MAIEIVGAGGGMRTAGVETRVSRGVVSKGLCGMFEPRESLLKLDYTQGGVIEGLCGMFEPRDNF